MLGLRPLRLRILIEVRLTTRKTVKATVNPIKSEKSFSTISWAAIKKNERTNEILTRKKERTSFLSLLRCTGVRVHKKTLKNLHFIRVLDYVWTRQK